MVESSKPASSYFSITIPCLGFGVNSSIRRAGVASRLHDGLGFGDLVQGEEEMGEDDPEMPESIDAAPIDAPPLPDNRPPQEVKEEVKERVKAEPKEDDKVHEAEAVQAAEVAAVGGVSTLDPSMQDTLLMADDDWSEPRISKALSQDSGPQSLLSSPEVKASYKVLPDPAAEPSIREDLQNPEPPSPQDLQKPDPPCPEDLQKPEPPCPEDRAATSVAKDCMQP